MCHYRCRPYVIYHHAQLTEQALMGNLIDTCSVALPTSRKIQLRKENNMMAMITP